MGSWADELATLNGPSWDDELSTLNEPPPKVGATPEGIDTDREAAQQRYGAMEAPTLDFTHRPWVPNADGSTSTVRSMGVNLGGKEYLIPTVSDDGAIMGDDEAIDSFRQSGQHMGVYASPDDSDRAAELIHQDQARNPPTNTLTPQQTFKPFNGTFEPGSKGGFSGSNSAGSPVWSGDSLDTLADFGQRAAMSATMGYGDEALGALGADEGAIRNRVQLAKERSPTASLWGDVVGAAAPAIAAAPAMGALPLSGRVAAGMGLGAEQAGLSASGYADDGNRWQAATDAAPIGAALGGASELGASAVQGVGGAIQNKVVPWFRDQGLLNRAASTGRPMQQLSKEFGGRQGVIDAGQFMEDNGMTQWSPQKLQTNLDDYSSMRQGDQRSFLDELAQNPDAQSVDVNGVGQDLMGKGYDQSALAAPSAQQQGSQYMQAADSLANVAPGGQMPFETAWRNRQAFDQGAKWNQGPSGDQGLAAVNRDAATGMRDAMGTALDNTPSMPGAGANRPRWDSIQSDLSNSIGLSGGDDAALGREFSGAPSPLQLGPMAAAAGAGPVGYATTLAAKTGGRGMMADALGGGSSALDWLGSQGDNVAGGMQVGAGMGAQHVGESEGIKQSRGYLLPQAAQQMMQQPGALGPYEKQFWDAANSQDANALSQLIVRLSNTDSRFKQQILPQLQQLTAAEY